MAQSQHDSPSSVLQVACPRRPRQRRCLLKDCEQFFRPVHGLSRYCSLGCAAAACRHARWLAARKYRASEHGKEKRRLQCQRRRERLRDQAEAPAEPREGHHQKNFSDFSPCHRPGCYQCFAPLPGGAVKKFCSPLCRLALQGVLRRERRWKQRRRHALAPTASASRRRCGAGTPSAPHLGRGSPGG